MTQNISATFILNDLDCHLTGGKVEAKIFKNYIWSYDKGIQPSYKPQCT